MILPEAPRDREIYLQWVLDTCLHSLKDRKDHYQRRRQYMLFGTMTDQDILYNRIESHLDLVCAFLFASDHAEFQLSAKPNAAEYLVRQFAAAQVRCPQFLLDVGDDPFRLGTLIGETQRTQRIMRVADSDDLLGKQW